MEAFSANWIAAVTTGVLVLAAIVAALVRGRSKVDVAISAEHRAEQITLTASGDIQVVSILNEGDCLYETLKREPVDLPLPLREGEPVTLSYRDFPGIPRPAELILRVAGGDIRRVKLPAA